MIVVLTSITATIIIDKWINKQNITIRMSMMSPLLQCYMLACVHACFPSSNRWCCWLVSLLWFWWKCWRAIMRDTRQWMKKQMVMCFDRWSWEIWTMSFPPVLSWSLTCITTYNTQHTHIHTYTTRAFRVNRRGGLRLEACSWWCLSFPFKQKPVLRHLWRWSSVVGHRNVHCTIDLHWVSVSIAGIHMHTRLFMPREIRKCIEV